MSARATILVARCDSCHGHFLPRPGPCPSCGSRELVPVSVPGQGRVLAAVELLSPAAGWEFPHRLLVVELAHAVRVLAVGGAALPPIDQLVELRRDGEIYRAEPTAPEHA